MATKRPAKLAIGKKGGPKTPLCPETGKPMTAVKVLRNNGPSGMHWLVIEDFKGAPDDERRMRPIR
mgnify:CR=1 FL=1